MNEQQSACGIGGRRLYEWVLSHVWASHVSHMNEPCLTYERVMSHIWTSHVSHMNESHIWMSRDAYARHDTSDVRHDSFIFETWLIHIWDMTHSYVRHDISDERHDSFIFETWPIRMWDMTPSYVRHDSFVCETWQIRCQLWLVHMWDMAHSCMKHDPFICTGLNLCTKQNFRDFFVAKVFSWTQNFIFENFMQCELSEEKSLQGIKVMKRGYYCETSFKWLVFCSRTWQAVDTS